MFESVVLGANDAGSEIEIIKPEFDRCRVCGNGWGSCQSSRRCCFEQDGFGQAMDSLAAADVICFITPVYWHEMAEGIKSFIDRLRRCERGEEGRLAGKSILLVASAGGTGNGLVNCMHQMEQFCRHTQMKVFDFIAVNRWNRDYKGEAIYAASKAMASGRSPGITI
jgi:multimeric flavodoxin WrbA